MARQDLNFNIEISKETLNFFKQSAPHKLKEAREKSVEAMGMVWADRAKGITTDEDHIDTGLYVNSIGYATGEPNNPLYEMDSRANKTVLSIGADVAYAESLEKRYAIMARALDQSEDRMKKVAKTQIQKALDL